MSILQLLASGSIPLLLMVTPLLASAAGGDDTFSSTSEMAALARQEASLVSNLMEYREKLEERLSQAKRKVQEIKEKLTKEDDELGVKKVGKNLEKEDKKLMSLRSVLAKEMNELPSQQQMEGAAQGIFLLQVCPLKSPHCKFLDLYHRRPTTLTYQLLPAGSSVSLCFPTMARHLAKRWPQETLTFSARLPTTGASTTGQSNGFSRP